MPGKRIMYFDVTPEIILSILEHLSPQIPADTRIEQVILVNPLIPGSWPGTIRFYVNSQSFDLVPEGHACGELKPIAISDKLKRVKAYVLDE